MTSARATELTIPDSTLMAAALAAEAEALRTAREIAAAQSKAVLQALAVADDIARIINNMNWKPPF